MSKGKDINTGLDAKVEVNTGEIEVNTGSIKVNIGREKINICNALVVVQTVNIKIPSPVKGQREGKAPMTTEDDEEAARQKRKAKVQEAAQFYIEEDWDTIRAKLEANTELIKSLQGESVTDDDFAKRMVEMINQKNKKGIHTHKSAKDEAEESMEAIEKDDPSSGKKGMYQIVRENGTDKIYINFGAMLKDISRDDLTELYKLVMQRYGTNRLEDEYERVFWGDLKTMFAPPLSTNPIWNLPGQQKMEGLLVVVCMVWVSGSYDGVEKDCLSVGFATIQQMVISSPCLTDIKNWLVQSKRLTIHIGYNPYKARRSIELGSISGIRACRETLRSDDIPPPATPQT
ncbi:hypothetical protein Tco_0170070 [Tanacetum coccineum]